MSKKNYPGSAWRALAAKVYDDVAESSGPATFDKTEVVELVKERLMEEDGAVEELCWAAAEGLVRDIDDHRTSPAKPEALREQAAGPNPECPSRCSNSLHQRPRF